MALVTCSCAFRLRRLAQNHVAGGVLGHFLVKFPHNIALLTCPCAFRLQARPKPCPRSCPRLFPCKFPRNMCISTRRLAQNGCRGIGVLHFPVYTGSCDMSFRLSTAKTPLLGACTEILARNLFWRSCSEILPRDLLQGSCHRALTEILSRALAKRPLKEILPTQLL